MGERRMYAGNWTCSQCGNAITELPFQPDPSRATNIQCRDCYRSGRM
jgi:CxxC-x17-CxxC domain-containing protein